MRPRHKCRGLIVFFIDILSQAFLMFTDTFLMFTENGVCLITKKNKINAGMLSE